MCASSGAVGFLLFDDVQVYHKGHGFSDYNSKFGHAAQFVSESWGVKYREA